MRSKPATILTLLIGAAAIVTLIATDDWAAIARTLLDAGWALLVVFALHLPQTAGAAWSWRALFGRRVPGLAASYALRWVRDSVNTLLPVAQVGGDVVRIRLGVGIGAVTAAEASAVTVVDVALEVVAQIGFTMAAVLLLMVGGRGGTHAASVLAWTTSVGCAIILLALEGARRFGLLDRLGRFAAGRFQGGADGVAAVRTAVVELQQQPLRLATCLGGHLLAWALGSLETWAALWAIGVNTSLTAAVVIEALGHVARAVGFFIPGALGVQEGGYVLVCGLYGIASPLALSLSMVKRLRELALGVPGLLLWGWLERRPAAASAP